MLRIFQRLWQVNWSEQWQYRANLIMYLLFWLVSPVVYLAVWTTVAGAQGTVRVVGQPDERGLTEVYYRPPKAFLEPRSLLTVLRKRLVG